LLRIVLPTLFALAIAIFIWFVFSPISFMTGLICAVMAFAFGTMMVLMSSHHNGKLAGAIGIMIVLAFLSYAILHTLPLV
jgi:hypothetical protein